jgi:hypothetical protein
MYYKKLVEFYQKRRYLIGLLKCISRLYTAPYRVF